MQIHSMVSDLWDSINFSGYCCQQIMQQEDFKIFFPEPEENKNIFIVLE